MIKRFVPLWILVSLLFSAFPLTGAAAHARADGATAYSVSGWVNSNGLAYLEPVWSQTGTLDESSDPPRSSAFCLDGKDLQSNLLGSRCFDIIFPPHDPNGDALVERFNLVLNLPSPAVSISLREGDEVLAERRASSNPPVIAFNRAGALLPAEGQADLTWQAFDTDGDALLFRVWYNPGSGWQLLESDLSTPSLSVDLENLPGSDTAVVRVEVTDGFLVSLVVSPPFKVNNKPPRILITAPSDGEILAENEMVRLSAQVEDLEEGELSKTQMRWSSNIQGDLGQGPALDVKLSSGEHTLTLKANDRSGRSTNASVQVTVGVPKPPLAGEGGLFSTQNLLVGGAVLMALVLVLGGVSMYFERHKPVELVVPAARKRSSAPPKHSVHAAPLPRAPESTDSQHPEKPLIGTEAPLDEETVYLQALRDIKAGHYQLGAKPLAIYMQAHPDRRNGWMWLGHAALKLNRKDTARTCFQRARSLGHLAAKKALQDLDNEKV